MNEKDFRIGNLIWDIETQQEYPIEQIEKDKDGFKGYFVTFRNGSFKSLIHESSGIEPIPLTEEWLIRLGGINHATCHTIKGYVLHKKDDFWQVENNVVWEQNGKTYSRFFKMAEIKYVHTLQNFIFANKNEELKLKE